MKSFTLHLLVLFVIGIQQNVYSSSAAATTTTTTTSTKSIASSNYNPNKKTTENYSSSILSYQAITAEPQVIEITKALVKSTTTSATASKSSLSSLQKNKITTNKQKSRTARDLPIKNAESSENNDGNNFIGNNGNNGILCITHLKDENEKNDCLEQQQKQQQQQQQQQQEQQRQEELSKQEEQLNSLNQASQSLWHETQHIHRVRRTSKTPRTIQRLIAGHLTLSNDPASSTTRIQPISTTTKIELISSDDDSQLLSTNIPNLTTPPTLRKPYRSRTYGNILRKRIPISTTTTSKPSIKYEDYDSKKNDDEAFLEDPKELDNWDNGILRLSAGDGKEDKTKSKTKLDPNKTLSEQVKDGKYGLIEDELFKKRPKRPGILSYLQNKEFPHDNEKTLGGLNEQDIWLAEDHLLVIKGGGLNDKDKNEPWAPIDDYIESDRPIKIPDNPQVPPPFPIQLGENEPLQFVGDNQITFGNPSLIDQSSGTTLPFYSAGNENESQDENKDNNKENISTRKGSNQGTTKLASIPKSNNPEEGYFYPRGNPVWNFKNGTLFNPFLNFKPLNYPAVSSNGSIDEILDGFDEDDASLYYPPPYSFVYKSNYTNSVPAGPLVPGIILPPPPNAFSRLESEKTTRKPRPIRPSFRQKLTRLQEYKPKTMVVTPDSITSTIPTTIKYTTSSIKPTTTSTTSNLPTLDHNLNKEIVYAVTQAPPSYGKVRYYTPSSRTYTTSTTIKTPTEPAPVEEIISFVPQIDIRPPHKDDALSLKHPIYYEYYDTKPSPAPTPEVYYKEILPPTIPPSPTIPLQHSTTPLSQPISQNPSSYPATTTIPAPAPKQYSTRKNKSSKITTIKPVPRKPHKHYSSDGKTYLTPRPYNFDDYINIKPQPEIRPNGIAHYDAQSETVKPIYNRKTYPNFDHEVNSIRQTLDFYNGQQPNTNYQQSTHNPKSIYEYSFDAAKAIPTTPKPQFDTEPFQPMVKYSSPVDDVNGFRAITYPEQNDPNYYNVYTESPEPQRSNQNNDRIRVQIIYDSTARPENGFYSNSPQATHSTLTQSQNPWISIEKQVVQEIGNNGLPITTRHPPKRRPSSRKIQKIPNNKFNGYYYNSPQAAASQNQRTNNRYYEEPFSKHLSEIRKKLGTANNQQQSQFNQQNGTNFNYAIPRPTFNSNVDQPFEQYLRERTFEETTTTLNPPLLMSEDDINVSNQQYKTIIADSITENLPQQRWPNQQPPIQYVMSLENDTNVNNITYGRPPVNPNVEWIVRQSTPHKTHREKYRDGSKSIKTNPEPFKQYLREVTYSENLTPSQSQKIWPLESQTSESINRHAEILEQTNHHPSHNQYRKQQLSQQQLHRINNAPSFKQYVRKIAPGKNYNQHPIQIWSLENDTNVNHIPYGRPPINPDAEFIAIPQRRPSSSSIYRDNIREFSPPKILHQQQNSQQQQQQQLQQHHSQQQQACKWPNNCNNNFNGQQQNKVVLPGHSLHSDTNINYGQKLPTLNPNSEFINPYQPFLNEYKQQQQQQSSSIKQQQQQQLGPKPIYNRPQYLIDSSTNYYPQEQQNYYQHNNNQRPQRPPK